MERDETYEHAQKLLKMTGLRPTRQRLGLAHLLFDQGNRHVTAEGLHSEACKSGLSVSLATVYNTLHQFMEAGLLNQVNLEGARTYFDTNLEPHGHYYFADRRELMDVPAPGFDKTALPAPPEGTQITRVDVIVTLHDVPK
ncbi:MAG: transcriptional repressor [Alphaproteobacteria bacterium]|nr:MAG: transcriptional repressor [Alphaproteobacteria bacterium]